MKRLYAIVIAILLFLTMMPGDANAGAAAPAESAAQTAAMSSPSASMPSLTDDPTSQLYRAYTVKRGDNLISISKKLGVPWRDLAVLNGIKRPKYTIYPGQILKIPIMPKLPGATGNYLILCETEAQKQYVADFAAFKILNGYTVTIKSMEADVRRKANADTSDEIRQYLKKMDKEMSLEYVLLVGTPFNEKTVCLQHTGGAIPMRYLYDNPANRDYSWYDGKSNTVFKTATDIYYALDIDWDFDKDGFAGEMQEMAQYVESATPDWLFLLGRVPFSDAQSIKKVLDTTMKFEKTQKAHSDALIGSYGIWAYYSDALAKNLVNAKIEAVTLYGDDENGPCQYKSTYPLNPENFNREISKAYDFVYTMGDIENYSRTPFKAGILFLDSSETFEVKPSKYDKFTAMDVLANGSACAVIATTKEVGFNPTDPAPRLSSRLFSNKTLRISGEFYTAALSSIMAGDVLEAYVYCYLGDPSIALKP